MKAKTFAKKISSIFLIIVLIFSLTIPAFASGTIQP